MMTFFVEKATPMIFTHCKYHLTGVVCMNAMIKSYLRVVQELHMYRHNTSADLCQMKNLQKKEKVK